MHRVVPAAETTFIYEEKMYIDLQHKPNALQI